MNITENRNTRILLLAAAITCTSCGKEKAVLTSDSVPAGETANDGKTGEKLDRGLLAMKKADGSVYLGWRFFGNDAAETVFEVFRKDGDGDARKIGEVRDSTNFVDKSAPDSGVASYHISTLIEGWKPVESKSFEIDLGAESRDYISIPITEAAKGYMTPAVADLDGDGAMDFIVKTPDSYLDPAEGNWHKDKRSYKMHAFSSKGKSLWMNDIGKSVEVGVWYSPYIAYDFDGDGSAEVALKTGGTTNQPDAIPEMDEKGRVTGGDEFLSIWDGKTGKEVASAPWPDREGYKGYNFYSRNLIGLAYLDGKTPAIIVVRGTYGMIKIDAYNYGDGKLTKLWGWKSTDESAPGYHGDGSRDGSGAHFIHAADVDGDGKDEIAYGSFVLDDNGKGLWCLDRKEQGIESPGGHPDGTWLGDILPERPGLEIFLSFEKWQKKNGACLVDARTGEMIWGIDEKSGHFHKAGMCADIDARYPGMECYAKDFELKTRDIHHAWMWSADGKIVAEKEVSKWSLQPDTVYWDADPQREVILDGKVVSYPENEEFLEMKEAGRTLMVADIIGDWREEIIRSSKTTNEIRIYSSTIPSKTRRPTLLEDPIYRIDVTNASMGYNQSPMVSRPFTDGE